MSRGGNLRPFGNRMVDYAALIRRTAVGKSTFTVTPRNLIFVITTALPWAWMTRFAPKPSFVVSWVRGSPIGSLI
jgi:hypothetical protein